MIVEHSNPQPPAIAYFPGDNLFTPYERRRGLPIGNLTSQFWANVYLDDFDHHFRDGLAVPGYIRYVDDFLVFSNDKALLNGWREEAKKRLERLRLLLHERKSRIFPVTEGIPFSRVSRVPERSQAVAGFRKARAKTADPPGRGVSARGDRNGCGAEVCLRMDCARRTWQHERITASPV